MPHPPHVPRQIVVWLFVSIAISFTLGCGVTHWGSQPNISGRPIGAPGIVLTPPAVLGSTPLLPADRSLVALVSKDRALAPDYQPADLVRISPEFTSSLEPQQMRRPAAEALTQMLTDARIAGISIKVSSAYRSYQTQSAVLQSEIVADGCAKALLESATPGHSEHQLGLAADLTSADVGWDLQDKFGDMPEGHWLLAHAAQYGFVLSYPKDKEAITGYIYEPWHFRYVTVPVAQAIVTSGRTATEYLKSLGDTANAITQAGVSAAPCH
jgi:D-alanyl-D-alanine carboxypeptidase